MEIKTLKITVNTMKSLLKEKSQEMQIRNTMTEWHKDVDKLNIQDKTPVLAEANKKYEAPKWILMMKTGAMRVIRCSEQKKDVDNHVEAKHNEGI